MQDRVAERWEVFDTGADFVVIGDDTGAEARLEFRTAETHLGFVVVSVEVINHHAMAVDRALALNAELELGGLCVADGMYRLRHGLPLETSSIADLDRTLAYLITVAATIRADLQPPGLGCFTCYED